MIIHHPVLNKSNATELNYILCSLSLGQPTILKLRLWSVFATYLEPQLGSNAAYDLG